MSTEPALMSLTAVAKAIAAKQVSSQEVDALLPASHRAMAAAAQRLHVDRGRGGVEGGRRGRCRAGKGKSRGPLHGVPLAHKDMYYDAGHVVTCGSKIRRDFVPTTTSTALQRLKDAGIDPARLAADGGVRLWPDRAQFPSWRGA